MLKRKRLLLALLAVFSILIVVHLTNSEPLTKEVRKVSDKTKLEVKQRDNFQCVICGSKENLQIDHKIPLWKGGSNNTENLQTLCSSHHLQKSREEMKEYRVFIKEFLRKSDYRCSYCGARAPPNDLELAFRLSPEYGGKYIAENLKTICKSCASKPKAIYANGILIEEGKTVPNTDFTMKIISENKAIFTNSRNKEIIEHPLKIEGKGATNAFRIEGSINYCEYCGKPAYGWCHIRKKYVCEDHRQFTQGTTRWICP